MTHPRIVFGCLSSGQVAFALLEVGCWRVAQGENCLANNHSVTKVP